MKKGSLFWIGMSLLLAIAGVVLGIALAEGTLINVRWSIYLLIVPFGMFFLSQIRNSLLLFLALLAPLILLENSLISMRPLGPVYIGLSLPIMLVILTTIEFRNPLRTDNRSWVMPWVLVVILAGVSVLREPDNLREAGRMYQVLYLQGGILIVFGRVMIRSIQDLENLAKSIIFIAVICSLLQLFFLRTGIPILQPTYNEFQLGQATWRYGGPFGNPNSLANYFAIAVSFLLLLFFHNKNRNQRYFMGFIGVALIGSGLITGSRGGNFATLFGLISVLAFLRGKSPWRIWALPLLTAGALLAVQTIFPETMNKSLERLAGVSDTVRLEIWGATLELLKDFPMGVGLTSKIFAEELNRVHPGFFFANPHSIYLGVMVQTGILGFLAMATLVGGALSHGLYTVRQSGRRYYSPLYAIPAIGILVFLCGGITEPIFSNGHKLNHLFWILIGAATRIPAIAQQQNNRMAEMPAGTRFSSN